MARIRTIKPEFPQSESMGKVSRDARLLFILLWTIADDHGRARAHSRMLASLLFPYDEDAGSLVPTWLNELQDEGCIRLYEASGSQYLQITQWARHQKIDKPSKPQHPGIDDDTREASRDSIEVSENPSLGREGKGREGSRGESNPRLEDSPERKRSPAFVKPTVNEVAAYIRERGSAIDPQAFVDHYAANGWHVGKSRMRDWRAAVRTWERSPQRDTQRPVRVDHPSPAALRPL